MKNNRFGLYFLLLFMTCLIFVRCTTDNANSLSSDNEKLAQIIQEHFNAKKVVPKLIQFSENQSNTTNRSTSTNHFPTGTKHQDSIHLHYDFLDLLKKEKFITEAEYNLFTPVQISQTTFPTSLNHKDIHTTTKESYHVSPKGDKIREYNQFSPVILFNNKAILYRQYFNQYGVLPAVTDGTFYLYSRQNNRWKLEYKWTAWIS